MIPTSKNNNSLTEKSIHDLLRQLPVVLDMVKQNGASDAVVSAHYDQGFSVDVRMGEVDTLAFSEDKGIHLTVYFGNQKGEASSTDTSPQALKKVVEAACDIAKVSASDPCFGLADKTLMSPEYPDLDLYHPWAITPEQAIQEALACESKALSLDKRIHNSDGVSLSTLTRHYAFMNTYGIEGNVRSSRHSLSCSLLAKEKESMQRDYDYSVSLKPEGLSSLDKLAEQAVSRTVERLGSRQIKTQKSPVLFSSRLSHGLLSHLIKAISGGSIYRKQSFLKDYLDKQIFPDFVTVFEQPLLLNRLGSAPFDDEGVLTRNNTFIQNGILKQYALGSYSARKLGLQSTGNAGGVHNLCITPTAGHLDELIKKMDKGLLVTELMGQGVNILTGDYSRGAAGFWVEQGKIQYPVESITIAGNLKDMFKSILAIGSDINPNVATQCGSILIEEMMIAGASSEK